MHETIIEYLSRLLQYHGLPCELKDGWLKPHGKLPAVRALWYPGQNAGRLDIEVQVEPERIIVESFAGLGHGMNGLRSALENFTLNVFHVLLSALWEKHDPAQVTSKTWHLQETPYTAHIGNFGARASENLSANIPDNLLQSLETTIKDEALSENLHWFRLFFCNVAQAFTFEALKDNERWEHGVHCLQNAAWQKAEGYYSVRLFIMLVRTART